MSAIREHYLLHVLLTVKQLCWGVKNTYKDTHTHVYKNTFFLTHCKNMQLLTTPISLCFYIEVVQINPQFFFVLFYSVG